MVKKFFQRVHLRLAGVFRSADKKKKSGSQAANASVEETGRKRLSEDKNAGPVRSGGTETSSPADEKTGGGERRRKRTKRKRWQLEEFQVAPVPGKVRFHDMDLPLQVMRAIAELDFRYCTPIQAEALPHLLAGNDLVGHAQTGTGKSAVFLITIFARLLRLRKERREAKEQALIIAPTRELVIQIAKDGRKLGKFANIRIAAVYGGTDYQKQMDFLEKKPCDIIVATPGRLLDFCRKKVVALNNCRTLVIDEADRMLDMGFIPDVRRIVDMLPERKMRQTLMFSATITEEVKRLAYQWCEKPVNVAIEPEQVAVDSVEQKVYLVTSSEKYAILYNLIQKNRGERMAVFTNQKIEAKRLYDRLRRNGINCTLLTGDVPQNKRTQRLESFREGRVPILVATDVAGRGIHIEGITHVVNYTLPYEPEDYVHRIGRTGRAGAEGTSVSFADEEESFVLPEIEEYLGQKLTCSMPEEDLLVPPPKGSVDRERKSRPQGGRKPGRRNPAKRRVGNKGG